MNTVGGMRQFQCIIWDNNTKEVYVVDCVIRNYINSIIKRIYVSENEKIKCITDSDLMKHSKLIKLWHKAVHVIPSGNTE